jgi:dienelactone hydrolase
MSGRRVRRRDMGFLNPRFWMTAALGLMIGALAAGPVLADKPPLDFNAFDDWPLAQGAVLSTNGRYGLYVVSHRRKDASNMLVVKALRGGWRMERDVLGSAQVTRDGRTAVFIEPSHTLCLLTLGTSNAETIPHVGAYRLVNRRGGEWLVYQSDDNLKNLVVRDLTGSSTKAFAGVVNYWFSGDGQTLLLQTAPTPAGSGSATALQSLQWIRLPDGIAVTFWRGATVSDLTFDATNTQVAWMSTDEEGGKATGSLWYYRAGANKARLLVDQHSSGIDDDLYLDGISYQGFSRDGDRIFVNLKEKAFASLPDDAVKVDVWSYKDPKLQSQQLRELTPISPEVGGPRRFVAAVPIHAPHVIRLEYENEKIEFPDGKVKDAVLLLKMGNGNWDERNWSPTTNSVSYFLLSTKDGRRRRLALKGFLSLSPDGKYILVEDEWYRSMSSYAIATGTQRDLTHELPIPLIEQNYDDNALPPPRGIQRVAWMDHDAILVSDRYDLWRLNLTGRTDPFNVTRGFGRRHDMEFQLTSPYYELIENGRRLLLHVVSHSTNEEGFYSQTVGSRRDPRLLTMGPYRYELMSPHSSAGSAPWAVKGVMHLVRRESASEAPNYFYTQDFETFTPLSQVYPERAYNWLTANLLSWKTPDGGTAQGVLYKPENFEPTRKYPVIFHYYEKLSDQLNHYDVPRPMSNNLPIPWFVSHGYLVFTPDIHYTIGHPGRSALDAVVSAAKYLATFPWVDARKMGLQGHSWGGFETDYIVTHTDLFAAAMSSSGISDAVSDYDSVTASGDSKQYFYEMHQSRIGPTLWQRPDLYLENSPIFQADKVTTPLLMMNNKDDPIVAFAQGVEFFVGLRRLGKKVWMLQYDGQGHSLSDEQAMRQHTVRVTQFFDYYLKNAPPPIWMTKGIPARLKGIETGLELDTSGAVP